ncbi:MAG: NADH-ubiquinone oxidoreductase chain N, partial [uncultured Phycisphaerae bacterium]
EPPHRPGPRARPDRRRVRAVLPRHAPQGGPAAAERHDRDRHARDRVRLAGPRLPERPVRPGHGRHVQRRPGRRVLRVRQGDGGRRRRRPRAARLARQPQRDRVGQHGLRRGRRRVLRPHPPVPGRRVPRLVRQRHHPAVPGDRAGRHPDVHHRQHLPPAAGRPGGGRQVLLPRRDGGRRPAVRVQLRVRGDRPDPARPDRGRAGQAPRPGHQRVGPADRLHLARARADRAARRVRVQDRGRPVPHVRRRRLPGGGHPGHRPDRVRPQDQRVPGHPQGAGGRRRPALRRPAGGRPDAVGRGPADDDVRQRARAAPAERQAGAGLQLGRPQRVRAGRRDGPGDGRAGVAGAGRNRPGRDRQCEGERRRRPAVGHRRRPVLPGHVRADERRGARVPDAVPDPRAHGGRGPRPPARHDGRDVRGSGRARQEPPGPRPRHGHLLLLADRAAADRRVPRQDLPDRPGPAGQDAVAGRADAAERGHLGRLLPEDRRDPVRPPAAGPRDRRRGGRADQDRPVGPAVARRRNLGGRDAGVRADLATDRRADPPARCRRHHPDPARQFAAAHHGPDQGRRRDAGRRAADRRPL